MRILRSIRSVNPAWGGPIEGIKQVSAIHLRDGHEVEIVSLDHAVDPWVRECPLRVHALGENMGHYGYSRSFVPWLRKHHARYDAVIVNGIWQYNSLGAWRALRNAATPYFVFPHGMLDPWFKRHYPLKHLKKWLYWPWAEYQVLRDACRVLFTCEEERRLARRSFWLYRCRETVVNYGTAAPPPVPDAQKALFLERFPALRGKRIILFLGRLHEKKGCDMLIRAFHQITAARVEFPDLRLVLAGPDQTGWQAKLEKLARSLQITDSVIFTGMLSGDLKWGAYRASEVFVLPSHQENFGVAVTEALACGLPVLVSHAVNIWREVESEGAGLAAADDEAGTVHLLERWLALENQDKLKMQRNALSLFGRRFEASRAAQSLLEVIESALLKNTPPHKKCEGELVPQALN